MTESTKQSKQLTAEERRLKESR